MSPTNTPWRAWLDDAQESHPQAPQRVAEALLARAATLPDDADGAEAVRLAEHVMLGHLADAAMLARFVAQLPATPGLQPAAERARWALWQLARLDEVDSAAAMPPPALPAAARWRALQNVVLALVARGEPQRAGALLRRDEAEATTSAVADERVACAACSNNVAAELRQGPRGDAARDALMLEAATLARRAWAAAGTWLQVQRAEYQLALCHAVLGQGEAALRHAGACLALCEAEGADAVERFFAHEALARAHRAQMQALLGEITDPAMKDWCAQTLALPMQP